MTLVLVLVVAVGGLVGWVIGRGLPQREATARLAGLSAEVTVIRDAAGIPQVYASSAGDLFMAQGWLHARSRRRDARADALIEPGRGLWALV